MQHLGAGFLHPSVRDRELACGSLHDRETILGYLDRLDAAPEATSHEVRTLIETHQLMGHGLGWTDVHLVASCRIARASLWSLDRPLQRAARRLGIAV